MSSAQAQKGYFSVETANNSLDIIAPNGTVNAVVGTVNVAGNAVITALAYDTTGDKLYGGTSDGNFLQINPLTGTILTTTATGSATAIYGLAFAGTTLYGLQDGGQDTNSGTPFAERLLNLSGATPTLANTIVDNSASAVSNLQTLAFSNNQLIATDSFLGTSSGSYVFSLPVTNTGGTTTESAVTTGGTGLNLAALNALAFNPDINQLVGLNSDPGTPSDFALYSIDPVDPSTANQIGSTGVRLSGLAYGATLTVPEVSTLALFAFSALPVCAAMLRRRAARLERNISL